MVGLNGLHHPKFRLRVVQNLVMRVVIGFGKGDVPIGRAVWAISIRAEAEIEGAVGVVLPHVSNSIVKEESHPAIVQVRVLVAVLRDLRTRQNVVLVGRMEVTPAPTTTWSERFQHRVIEQLQTLGGGEYGLGTPNRKVHESPRFASIHQNDLGAIDCIQLLAKRGNGVVRAVGENEVGLPGRISTMSGVVEQQYIVRLGLSRNRRQNRFHLGGGYFPGKNLRLVGRVGMVQAFPNILGVIRRGIQVIRSSTVITDSHRNQPVSAGCCTGSTRGKTPCGTGGLPSPVVFGDYLPVIRGLPG